MYICVVTISQAHAKRTKNNDKWDHADLLSYYGTTMSCLYPLYYELVDYESSIGILSNTERQNFVDCFYQRIVDILNYSSKQYVPMRYKNFYKFWWSEELTCLKEAAINSNNVWKAAGQPRSGPIADKRNADKRKYKSMLHKEKRAETQSYTNDLHEALLNKSHTNFWKCWKSKFDKNYHSTAVINGLTDDAEVAETFADFFCRTCTSFSEDQNTRLSSIYSKRRQNYVGDHFRDECRCDVDLVETACSKMRKGKAAGLDELSLEHLVHSHPILFVILAKLFNVIVDYGCVPYGFRLSYTVPLPKDDTLVKSNRVESYRAISISPVISKVFEHCILIKFNEYFATSHNQFGFKKRYGCSHAVYSVRKVVEHYVAGGSTVNVCQLDLSKAFDKMNHFGLYIKLMDRLIPVKILRVLEVWFNLYLSCVKLGSHFV